MSKDWKRAYKLRKDSGIDLTPPQWQDKHKYVVPNIDEVRSKVIAYYAGLNDDDKQTYSHYFKVDLMVFIKEVISPLHLKYDAYKAFYQECVSGEFWNVEPTHPVFGTESNERFFNYVMGCFKEDGRCYKQKTLSYVYRVMFKTIANSGMYIRYVNEHYGKDLKPIKEKLIGLTRIQEEPVVEEYNQVFKKAQSKWNDENPLYQKNFAHIYHVA